MKSTMLLCLLTSLFLFGCQQDSSDGLDPKGKRKANPNWPSVKFTEVRAYAWPTNLTLETVVLKNMQPAPDSFVPEGVRLSEEQVSRLVAAVRDPHPSHDTAGCYDPHNAFIFYKAQKPVAYVEICFGCLNFVTEPEGASDYLDLLALAKLFTELKLPLGEHANDADFNNYYKKITTR